MAVLRKHAAVLEVMKQRAEGEPVETPPLPAIGANPLPGGETLTAAFEGWKRQRERAPGTVTEYERAIRLFVELHDDLPVVQIRKSHARLFREALQDVPQRRTGKLLKAPLPEMAQWAREHPNTPKITAGTVNKLLGGVQAVAVWARDNGIVCESACKKDPLFGVIGIQSGPRNKGSTLASMILGGRGWDAGRGDDWEDPSRVF